MKDRFALLIFWLGFLTTVYMLSVLWMTFISGIEKSWWFDWLDNIGVWFIVLILGHPIGWIFRWLLTGKTSLLPKP